MDDRKTHEGELSRCRFDLLLWIVVVLLMLCFGAAVIVSLVFSAKLLSLPVVGAAVAAAVFCALLLAMLLVAYFALSLAQCCLQTEVLDTKYPDHGEHISINKE